MTISVTEMPSNMGVRAGGSGGLVSEVADEAATALNDIERFELQREQEEERRKKGGSRHENWFSKPHAATARKPNPRGAIQGALVEEPNWFSFVAKEEDKRESRSGGGGGGSSRGAVESQQGGRGASRSKRRSRRGN